MAADGLLHDLRAGIETFVHCGAGRPMPRQNDIVAALAKDGHKITPNLVYFIKGKSAAKKQRKKRVMKAAKAATSNGVASDPIKLIRDVRALAKPAGGYQRLKELVDALVG